MKIMNKVFLILFVLAVNHVAQNDLSFGFRRPEAPIDTFVKRVEKVDD